MPRLQYLFISAIVLLCLVSPGFSQEGPNRGQGSGRGSDGYPGGLTDGDYEGGYSPGDMGGIGGMAMGSFSTKTITLPGPDGNPHEVTSKSHWTFDYEVSSYRPQNVQLPAYTHMMGMDGMMGMGMAGSAAGGMYGGYGMESGYGTGDSSRSKKRVTIYAYNFESNQSRDHVELFVLTKIKDEGSMMDGMMGGAGDEMGGAGDMMGGMGGMGGGVMRISELQTLSSALADKNWNMLSASEAEIVGTLIRQTIWKEEFVKQLDLNKTKPAEFAKLEVQLKELLTEAYDTQLQRQEMEIAGIEERISQLRNELTRRQAAKTRVVEVQLGNIVLETQGLLGR
jgi:hypothetical protein